MRPFLVGRFPRGLLWFLIFGFTSAMAEERPVLPAPALLPCKAEAPMPSRAYPSANLGCGQQLSYLGSYSAEGLFLTIPRHERWYNRDGEEVHSFTFRPPEVPPSVNLHSSERKVESYLPPMHASQPLKGPSKLATFRDNIITFVYGHEKVMLSPHHVVVDSRGRVLITDPSAHAIHILDGKNSFRLMTGAERRVEKPNGIAVDSEDNIYIADQARGLVAVFDADGNFIRYIGKLGHDENLFHMPTGIAVDRATDHVYVLDSERHMIFVLDRQGEILRRIGRYNSNDVIVDFELPSEVTINGTELVVLDAADTRVNILDLSGNLKHRFSLGTVNNHALADRFGLAMDSSGHIYIGNASDSMVRVFDTSGHLLTSFGQPGIQAGEFLSPAGLWIDSANKIYVADERNRRVQVFQLASSETMNEKATAPSGTHGIPVDDQVNGSSRQ